MSIKAINWATSTTTGSPVKKIILMLLADLADENHSCWPSVEYLHTHAEISKRSMITYLNELEKMGLIKRQRRDYGYGARTTNRYILAVDGLFETSVTPTATDSSLGANLAPSDKTPDHKLSANLAPSDKTLLDNTPNDASLSANCCTYIDPTLEIKDKSLIRESEPAVRADEVGSKKVNEIDQALQAFDPALTVANISKRLKIADPAEVDYVRAAKTILGRATNPIVNLAAFVAGAIDRSPESWSLTSEVFDGPALVAEQSNEMARLKREEKRNKQSSIKVNCSSGRHDWGPISWGEQARSSCVFCGARRNQVEPDYDADVALLSADGQVI